MEQVNITYRNGNPFRLDHDRPRPVEENPTETAARRQAVNQVKEKRKGRPFKEVQTWAEIDGIAQTEIDGYVVTVDRDKLPLVKDHRWYLLHRGRNTYACTGQGIYMHRVVLGLERGDSTKVDHIDHDGLNNRESNLRRCSQSCNQANQRKRTRQCTSKYKGVRLHEGKWLAAIKKGGQRKHLGSFTSEIAAAMAYDAWAYELFREYAHTNFPVPSHLDLLPQEAA